MRKIVFALSVVLTVMTACEDNNDSTINGNRSAVPFSNNDGVYASIDIDYGNYQALRILQKTDTYEQAYTATTPANDGINNQSGVPCLFLAELYPLSLHTAALYGKFLGEPFPILIDRIIPDGNKEVTNYIFSFDKRNLMTSCKEVINSYGTDYTRTVSYVIE